MSATRMACSTAVRLIRRAPVRSAVIAGTIAVPTAVAVAAWIADWETAPGLAACAVSAAVAMLVVAQTSPEPTTVASAHAWRALGAEPRAAARPQRIATGLVGWAGVTVGVAVGTVLGGYLDHRRHPRSGPVLPADMGRPAIALLVGLGLVVPGSVLLVRRRMEPKRTRQVRRRGVRLALGAVLVVAAAALDVAVAGSVRTDFDAALAVPLATLLTVVVVLSAVGSVTKGSTWLLERSASWRAAVHLAGRHPSGRLVRLVVVASMVVAVTGFALGGSVAVRSHRIAKATTALHRLPVVPPNVMVLERCCRPRQFGDGLAPGSASSFSLVNIGDVARRFPGSDVIPIRELSGPRSGLAFSCSFAGLLTVAASDAVSCSDPVVLADPRLNRVFGSPQQRPIPMVMSWAASPAEVSICSDASHCRVVSGRANVAGPSDAVRARLRGEPLPAATWSEQHFVELDRSALAGTGFVPAVRTLVITRATPYRATERRTLRALAADQHVSGEGGTAWTSDQRSTSFRSTVSMTVPWAPTAASTQWSIAAVASLLALLVVLGTGTVDALDRRRDIRRLELLGATPGQVSAGAALHAGLELGAAAVLAVAAVSGLVAFGLHRYSTSVPGFPLRFVLPLPQLGLLVLGVPAVGAALAAGVARLPGETPQPAGPVADESSERPGRHAVC